MIGVDTNVLVRVFAREASDETTAALRFLSERNSDEPAFVSVIVLVELAWVLKRSYGASPKTIFDALDSLLESSNIAVERSAEIEEAIATAKAARADIADCIIAATARAAGAGRTVTFDRKAAKRIPGMELLA
jgi:predicted nucleic-acid-binding protein